MTAAWLLAAEVATVHHCPNFVQCDTDKRDDEGEKKENKVFTDVESLPVLFLPYQNTFGLQKMSLLLEIKNNKLRYHLETKPV